MSWSRGVVSVVVLLIFFSCSPTPQPPYEALSDYFWSQRAYPSGLVNSELFHMEKNKVLAERQNRLRGGAEDWEFEGPTNVGGRITDVEMIPSSTDLIWVGSASGGAFKTEDQGSTWQAMTDMEGAPPIGDICVRPTNPQEVWIGTGETNGGSGSIAYEGFGVLKSINGGRTWEVTGLTQSGSIGRIAMHPTDPATVYVAAMGYLFAENEQRGIFKTTDGGRTWSKVLYLDNQTGGSDVIIDPTNPDIIYASMWQRIKYPDHKIYWGENSGIYKSTDGGENWEKLDITGDSRVLGRIGIGMAPSNPNRLFALVTGFDGEYEGLYRTDNGGDSWILKQPDLDFNYRTSGYWFCNVTINPQDQDELFICGLDMFRIMDGGDRRASVCGMHVDQHSIYLHPSNPDLGFVGNDGGLYRSTDRFATCSHYKNLPITQFYTCTIDPMDKERMYGGTQDNNPLIRRQKGGNWRKMLGGDGFVTLPHPRDNNILYTEYQYGNIFRSDSGAVNWYRVRDGLDMTRSNWNTPFLFSPHNDNVMFFGSHRVHRSDNQGFRWTPISPDLSKGPGRNLVYGTITSIDVSPVAPEVLIAGTDDGQVWITNSGGMRWELVSEDLPNRWVTRVVCDPYDVDKFYVTYSGLKWHDYMPHIFVSSNVGRSWEDISSNLPEVPVNDLIIDPYTLTTYWAATDLGVFESIDEGGSWSLLGSGMPVSIVNDIDFNPDTRRLLAGTYGRSMWSIHRPRLTTSTDRNSRTDVDAFYAEDLITITGPEGDYHLTIFSASGQVMNQFQLRNSGSPIQVDASFLNTSGMYVGRIETDGGMKSFQFVVR